MKRGLQFIGAVAVAATAGSFVCSLAMIAVYSALGVEYDADHVVRGWSMYLSGVCAGWYLFGDSA